MSPVLVRSTGAARYGVLCLRGTNGQPGVTTTNFPSWGCYKTRTSSVGGRCLLLAITFEATYWPRRECHQGIVGPVTWITSYGVVTRCWAGEP
jgi:hypothetical protein